MQKIDRLGWAAGVSFESYGLKIGVRVNAAEVPADVLDCLPPGWRPLDTPFVDYLLSFRLGGAGCRPGQKNFFLLHGGLTQLARTLDRDAALWALENALQMHVATRARDRAFVHAGVVGWRGRAILLPGRSMAGKSTLVKALLAAGATYYSDEYAVLDRKARVYPYPRKLSLRRPDAPALRVAAAELGAETATEPLPVGLMVFTEYRPGVVWRAQRLSPARALFELASTTLPAVSHSRLGGALLERLALSVPALHGRRGGAAEAAEEILRAADRPRRANPWRLLAAGADRLMEGSRS